MTKMAPSPGMIVAVLAACNLHFNHRSFQVEFVVVKFKMRRFCLEAFFSLLNRSNNAPYTYIHLSLMMCVRGN